MCHILYGIQRCSTSVHNATDIFRRKQAALSENHNASTRSEFRTAVLSSLRHEVIHRVRWFHSSHSKASLWAVAVAAEPQSSVRFLGSDAKPC